MKLAVITDSSAYLKLEVLEKENLFILDIPVFIDGKTYVEGKNLTAEEFYQKMALSAELPKTSQPSIAELEDLLSTLSGNGYTHVLGLFLSSGISGFYQNIQFLKDEFPQLEIAFPDSKITSAPLGIMVQSALNWAEAGLDFNEILARINVQIDGTSAFIMVDDLNHLVKGGRLSNGAAILGNLLSIKPILYFNYHGVIEVFEKIRTEKKATKRLIELVEERTSSGKYEIIVIHANAVDKAETLRQSLLESNISAEVSLATFGSVIGTHLGEGSIALGYIPLFD
ncbi:DegV family protein [Streptococcus gordonii]|uniref:DegV family protein n=1 Tax=Streptococcus gordonii TaxID=1302 RepID=UPI000E53FA6E|nr:DegV family protein [Streptococcus gordonii]RHE65684.1 DegV family protein [Streptococcus gordonii]